MRSETSRPLARASGAEILFERQVDRDDAAAGGPGHQLVHVRHAGAEQRAARRGRDHRDRPRTSARGERRAVDRIDRDVERRPLAVADLLAVVEHGRFVLLALADDHDAREQRRGERAAHRLDGRAVDRVLVAEADEPSGGDRRRLRRADERVLERMRSP